LGSWCISVAGLAPVCATPATPIADLGVVENTIDLHGISGLTGPVSVSVSINHARQSDLTVDLIAGPTDGAALLVWDGGRWREVQRSTASANAPASLAYTTTDAREIGRLLAGAHARLHAAVAPLAPNGIGRAQIASGDWQLDVAFHI